MNDLATDLADDTAPADDPSLADATSPQAPAALPPEPPALTPPAPVEPPSSPRRGGGWRFAGGLVTGLVVSAVAVGIVALASDDDSSVTGSAPVTTVAAGSADEPAAAVVPAGASVHDLVVAVRPSIVAIHTTLTQTDVFGQEVEGEAAGSGFVLSADGYVVTNNHVIDGASEITVTLDDGSNEQAELVAADPRSDLAVLHIDRTDLTPVSLGDSDAIRVGDPVVAIGNALDLGAEPTVTGGMISAKDRTISEPNGEVLVNLIQTDAAISPGNSGGPLLDMNGHVVGINTAVAGQGQNIGFAIAIAPAKTMIDQLRNGDVPRHALLGVSTRPPADGSAGAQVASVSPRSGADNGGVQEGDVITEFDGDPITSPEDLVAAIARHQPGDETTLTVQRDGAAKTLTVTLGAHDETGA